MDMDMDMKGQGQPNQEGMQATSAPVAPREDPQAVMQQLERVEEMADQLDGKLDAFLGNLEKLLSTMDHANTDVKAASEENYNEDSKQGSHLGK